MYLINGVADAASVPSAEAISHVLGWMYFLCWSLSFYPQPILNWRRRSTVGLAVDFPTINVLGFICYLISSLAFLYSPLIRQQYAARNPRSPEPTVRLNDLAFIVHAVVLSSVVFSQFYCWGFKRDRTDHLSMPIAGVIVGSLAGLALVAGIIVVEGEDGGRDPFDWAWIDMIYAISYVKLIVTIVKYMPQVWINYTRQSTAGWSIEQILLDFSGGFLSLVQLVLDSSMQGDWSGIAGNPVKLGLSTVSMAFDAIFLCQHYLLYRDAPAMTASVDSIRPLLESHDMEHTRLD